MDQETQNKNEVKQPTQTLGKELLVLFISTLFLAAWIFFLNWISDYSLNENYFEWFIKNGTVVSIATSFLALVWEGLEEQKGLLSWHPARFYVPALLYYQFFMRLFRQTLLDQLKD